MSARSWSSTLATSIAAILLQSQAQASSAPNVPLNQCEPFEPPAPIFASWQNDPAFTLLRTSTDAGEKVRLVGDVIVLSQDTVQSLLRDLDKPLTNVAELVIDAREVHLSGPLTFTTAHLTILAHELTIEDQGSIAFVGEPRSGGDGVDIRADRVLLKGTLPRPLQLLTSDGARPRVLRVRARELIDGSDSLQGSAATRRLWQRSLANFGESTPVLPTSFDAQFSDDAAEQAKADLAGQAGWPLYFANKVSRFYMRDPFSPGNRDTLTKLMVRYTPFIEQIGDTAAMTSLSATDLLMQLNVNAFGAGPGFIPRQDLVSAINRLSDRVNETYARLPALQSLILGSFDTAKVNDKQLAGVREEMQAAADAAEVARSRLSEAFTELAANEAQAVELNRLMQERQQDLVRKLQEMKEKQDDLADIKSVTQVVSVGAALIPAAGPFIAAGVAATGEAVYRHNLGEGGGGTIQTLAQIGTRAADFYAATKQAQAAWEAHRKDVSNVQSVWNGKPPTVDGGKVMSKADAAKAAAKSAGDFAKTVKAMYDQLEALPRPTEVSLNQLQAEDEALQSLLSALGERRNIQARLVAEVKGLEQTIASSAARATAARSAQETILAANPVNDADLVRWRLSAISLWRSALETLYRDAMLLRKSVYFETDKQLQIPPDVFQFPEEALSSLLLDTEPKSELARARTEQFIKDETVKHSVTLNAILAAARSALDQYASERAGPVTPYVQAFQFSDTSPSQTSRAFIAALNLQIQAQMRNVAANAPRVGTPLLIPLNLPPPPVDGPERLISIELSELKFENEQALAGKLVNFDVSYQLAGEVWQAGSCRFADMRLPGADNRAIKRISTANAAQATNRNIVPLTFQELSRYQAAPPARTPYFVAVQVSGSPDDVTWKTPPRIKSLVVTLRLVQ
ncbi:hypothetical protein ACFPN2_17535 [Steroidobacter flavus]|uniref:Uncharacterized protein n=1 Tax=Steroidobacter flavus TaxID=1842136 RepID=A0ABV8SVB7_9GAMM